MELVFSGFETTPLQPPHIRSIFASHFTDLEDALLYQCAHTSKTKLIITKDLTDFFASKIPVIHPQDFAERYYAKN